MGEAPLFACDAMLGGLARWLRAAGYDASWHPGIDDGELVRLCRAEGRVVLSSDDDIFGYALVRDGAARALFVPRGLSVQAQLEHVLGELALPLREPRCMACGGELVEMSAEEAAGSVPPRSLARHDRFWRCAGCGKALWHGTHWERIAERLRQAASGTGLAALSLAPAEAHPMSKVKQRQKSEAPPLGTVDQASDDSFPASDAPAYTPTTASGPPTDRAGGPGEDRLPEEVHEHPISDPASRSKEP